MIGLVIRVLVLCAVVFGLVYGLTRALRTRLQNREIERVAEEIARVADELKRLRTLIVQGGVAPREYAETAERIRTECKRLGLPDPELPNELPPRSQKD